MVDKDPRRIAAMFDAIAARYDLLNHLLSAGLDRRWRRRAVEALALRGGEWVLDLCTGTADLALAAVDGRRNGAAARVVGVDRAAGMLALGRAKIDRRGLGDRIALVRGDALGIPVRDEAVDAATVAFGIRNVPDAAAACREVYRVLKPGGRFAVLEFSLPTLAGVRPLYLWYFRRVLPTVGRLVSRHPGAYSYLPASVHEFPTPAEFVALVREAGFREVRAVRLALGIVYLYVAVK
jgi:demethylmenaquinone methyltransferase/2-methoxy-6-polyprenyl-1,4-benzoquinol methylase